MAPNNLITPLRSNNYSDLYTVVQSSIMSAYSSLLSIPPWYHNYFGMTDARINKANFIYVMIVDWKEYWEDI